MSIAFTHSYADLPPHFYTEQPPSPVVDPKLLFLNNALAQELQLDQAALRSADGIAMLAGNHVPDSARPLAQVYAGHQFGGWSPQLGDGRAVLLGEVIDRHGTRQDIQLKGSGPTPYSRMGDGRAWLGPVLREYIVSEAMASLGVPTTRALAAVSTGETVLREAPFPGAILTRVAISHIRVGTFQYFASRNDSAALKALTEHVIARHYPDATGPMDLLRQVCTAQAHLIAQWMSLGFIHGVMNTDNCHVAGITIDYGPCAFMDTYIPDKVFSSIDQFGRYAYNNQPEIVVWNLAQFATSLLPIMGDRDAAIEEATEVIHTIPDTFQAAWLALFRAKIGLTTSQSGDMQLLADLMTAMAQNQADFTNTFRALSGDKARDAFTDPAAFDTWETNWRARLASEPDGLAERLTKANPAFIPRNHRIEQAIQAALTGDLAPAQRLIDTLTRPFEDQPDAADLRRPPTDEEAVRQTFCGT
ncbi:YdiU family protein [Actibacterium sp. 188UL27-1]|uniref:protein adenylyltransferase SelO n=1 Tax=Actibacterium sp. 188UL27-1 TaxID=2786961 RepID=UPI00195CAC6A|nr:YdiU family protein [Actibacterium sp. 188UL27-1]MBM7066727.1 YdiU family protein [Actibacterium sp. 188UL27-1]